MVLRSVEDAYGSGSAAGEVPVNRALQDQGDSVKTGYRAGMGVPWIVIRSGQEFVRLTIIEHLPKSGLEQLLLNGFSGFRLNDRCTACLPRFQDY